MYKRQGLADTAGQVQSATSGHLVGQSVSKRPWFIEGRQGVFVGDVHEAVLLAKLLQTDPSAQPIRFIDFASPVYDTQGQLRGVLASHSHWRWAGDVLSVATPKNAAGTQTEVFIVNKDNDIIFPEQAVEGQTPPTVELRSASHDAFLSWGGATLYLTTMADVADPVAGTPLGWKVVVRQPMDIVLSSVRHLQAALLLIMGGGALAFLILAWLGAGYISRPLARLTNIARRIEKGEENVRFPVHGKTLELKRLSGALSGMANTLLERRRALEQLNTELEGRVAQRTAQLMAANEELRTLVRRDALTGLPNRFAANERIKEAYADVRRGVAPYAVLMVDIDHFKHINDSWGHAQGDAVLTRVAGVILHTLRETDFVARVGGEEFVVVLPRTGPAQALQVAEKIRVAVADTPIEPVGHVTVSVGLTVASPSDEAEDSAVRRADMLLYKAKQDGRNQVASAPPAND